MGGGRCSAWQGPGGGGRGVRNRGNEKALSDTIRRRVGAAPEEKRRVEDDMDQCLLIPRRRMDRRLALMLLPVAKRLAVRN